MASLPNSLPTEHEALQKKHLRCVFIFRALWVLLHAEPLVRDL